MTPEAIAPANDPYLHPRVAPVSFDLSGRAAIVTGGSQGIGWGIAAGLAQAGARIVVANRKEAIGETAAAALRDLGADAVYVQADVARAADADRVARATRDRFGRLDILVNCSGIVMRGTALELSEADFDATLSVNLKGAWLCSRAAAKLMIGAGTPGRIINVASLNAIRPGANKFAYATSKAGMVQLTRALATEWAPHGITVNAIAPGMISSPRMVEHFAAHPDERRKAIERIPLGRPGTPGDVAGLAVFLASDASAYVTGQAIFIDGGSGLT